MLVLGLQNPGEEQSFLMQHCGRVSAIAALCLDDIRNACSLEKINGRRVGPSKGVQYEGGEILHKTAGDVLRDTLLQTIGRSSPCKPCVYYTTEQLSLKKKY